MKKIDAYIKPIRLSPVLLALHHIEGLTGITITQAAGFGRGRMGKVLPAQQVSDLHPIVHIEVFCEDTRTDELINAIENEAHTGLRGDGKIYVSAVEQAIRISTAERGKSAV